MKNVIIGISIFGVALLGVWYFSKKETPVPVDQSLPARPAPELLPPESVHGVTDSDLETIARTFFEYLVATEDPVLETQAVVYAHALLSNDAQLVTPKTKEGIYAFAKITTPPDLGISTEDIEVSANGKGVLLGLNYSMYPRRLRFVQLVIENNTYVISTITER